MDQHYTGTRPFSSVVELFGLAVCKVRPSLHAAYQARAERLPACWSAVHAKALLTNVRGRLKQRTHSLRGSAG